MNSVLLIIIAILLPPLAVFLKEGAGKQFVINLLLPSCCCGSAASFMPSG